MTTKYHIVSLPPLSPSVPGVLVLGESKINSKGKRSYLNIRQAEWVATPGSESMTRTGQALRWAQADLAESDVELFIVTNNWIRGYELMSNAGFQVSQSIRITSGADPLEPPRTYSDSDWRIGRQYLMDLVRDEMLDLQLTLPVRPLEDHPEVVSHQDITRALTEALSKPRTMDVESDAHGITDRYENLLCGMGILFVAAPVRQGWGDPSIDYSHLDALVI